jgi:hypothetical protein
VIGGFQDNGTRVRVSNSTTFNQTIGGDGFGALVHANNGATMLGSLYYTRIYKSTDGGTNFVSASSGITESNNSAAAPFNTHFISFPGDATGNTVFTHVNLKVYKSTNYASTWTALGTTGFVGTGAIRNIGVSKSNVNVIGAVATGGRVFPHEQRWHELEAREHAAEQRLQHELRLVRSGEQQHRLRRLRGAERDQVAHVEVDRLRHNLDDPRRRGLRIPGGRGGEFAPARPEQRLDALCGHAPWCLSLA